MLPGLWVTQALIELLDDDDPLVRSFAIDSLQKIKDTRAIEPLIKALLDDDDEVRSSASTALLAITTLAYGNDYERWSAWWEENQYNFE